MKRIVEHIKHGLGVALSELFLFSIKIFACSFYVLVPLLLANIIPILISCLLLLLEVECEFLVFKILFSLFQIIAIPITMSWISYDDAVTEDGDAGSMFVPSKDLVIAVYVLINLHVGGVL